MADIVNLYNREEHQLMLYALILYVSGDAYNMKATPNDIFLRNFLCDRFYLLSELRPEICWD